MSTPEIAAPSRVLKAPPVPRAPKIAVQPQAHPLYQPATPRPSQVEPMEEKTGTTDQYCLHMTQKDKSGKNVDMLMGVFVLPIQSEIYKRVSQSKELAFYKDKSTSYNVRFVLVKNG